MADYVERYASKASDELEERIKRVYKQAAKEVRKKLEDFINGHRARNAKMLQMVADGQLSEQDYQKWMRGQVFQGDQWKQKLKDVTEVYVHADEKAREIVGGTSKNVFMEAANYTAYDLEKGLRGAVAFNVYDAKTVERLLRKDPKMLPEWKIDQPKDYTWNEKRVRNAVTQGIIQGESIEEVGERLTSELATSNAKKMDMFARTAVNGAQNAGRMDRLHEAEDMGIEVKKKWLATLDNRTRDTHQALDGQERPIDEPFVVDGMKIDYPGDPFAPPELVYNCRCTLTYVYPKYQHLQHNHERRDQLNDKNVENMTYYEWLGLEKRKGRKETEGTLTITLDDVRDVVNTYNDKMAKINVEIEQIDERYQELYGRSIFAYGTNEYEAINAELEKIEKHGTSLRNEIEKIMADKTKYLSQSADDQILSTFGQIRGKHDIYSDAQAVNLISADIRSQNNCGYCALAYDARRRGIDCHAMLISGANNNQVSEWWNGLQLTTSSIYSPKGAMDEISSLAVEWGDGARGIIQIDYTMTTGHYFVFEVEDGKCRFIDPQTGSVQAESLFEIAKPGTVRYGRTDNMPLSRFALLNLEKGGYKK